MTRNIQGIIVHRTESGRTGDEVKAAELNNGGLGYHYFIGPSGIRYEMYPDEITVWHARKWSKSTIGIAVYGDFHVPDGSKNNTVLPEQWTALVTLCKALVSKYGFIFIMGHTDLADATSFPDKVCPGSNLDVQSLAKAVYSRGPSITMPSIH